MTSEDDQLRGSWVAAGSGGADQQDIEVVAKALVDWQHVRAILDAVDNYIKDPSPTPRARFEQQFPELLWRPKR